MSVRAVAAAGFVMVLMVFSTAAACGGARPNGSVASRASASDVRDGHQLYDRYCALCHGAGAIGYAADNATQLRNQAFLRTATDRFMQIAIERGRPGTPMSAFGAAHGGPLDRSQTDRIIAYLRSLADASPIDVHDRRIEGDAARGAAIYRDRCSSCHGAAGEGTSAVSLDNPTFLVSASAGFIRYAIEHGRPGTPMPAFGAELSPQQIDDLTATIRSFGVPAEAAGATPTLSAASLPPLDRIVLNPNGPRAEFELREQRFVPADDVAAALRSRSRVVLLDARPVSDWHRGRIPGAHPTPFYADLDAIARALPRDGTWIIAYCACPHAASGKVVDALRARGFATTAVLDEGVLVWERRGYPIERTAAKPARGSSRPGLERAPWKTASKSLGCVERCVAEPARVRRELTGRARGRPGPRLHRDRAPRR
jgi:cytochrome c oxidase cbb3-type subunit III